MNPDTLYVTETDCAAALGFSPDRWSALRRQYERLGLPLPDPISKRRYWPAVRAFFDRHNGVAPGTPAEGDIEKGQENLDAFKPQGRRGRRARGDTSN